MSTCCWVSDWYIKFTLSHVERLFLGRNGMEITFFSVLALGFVLGIKHAVEPDHVIAVSTIASRSRKIWHASLAGVFWGIGHTATLFIVGITFILMKGEIPEKWA